MLHLWRGFHDSELIDLIKKTWQSEELLILIPNHLKDFSFIQSLASSEIIFHGDWNETLATEIKNRAKAKATSMNENPTGAVIGVFTSGSQSGQHRLILYSKKNILSSLQSIRSLFAVERIKNIFIYPQPTHTFGLVLGYLHAILNELQVHFHEGPYSKMTHEKWLSSVNQNTLTLGTPIHFYDLVNFVKAKGVSPNKSYSAIIGGARVSKSLWHQLKSELNIEAPSIGYGATEASPGVTHLAPGVPPLEDGDIGHALIGVSIELLMDDSAADSNGEGLQFRGDNVCLAILDGQRWDCSLQRILRDQLEMRELDGRQRFTFVGRTDFVINRGGIKISAENLESQLSLKLRLRCLVTSIFDERLGEDIAILIEAEVSQEEGLLSQAQDILWQDFNLKLFEKNIIFAKIPCSANGKVDRSEAHKVYLRRQKWQLPVAVANLKSYLPHRGPAVWIDSMLESRFRYGLALVVIDLSKNYCTQGKVRESASVEWVAQTYGYAVGLNDMMGVATTDKASKVYIAEVKSTEFFFESQNLRAGDLLKVEASCTHDFGSLKLVNGRVFHEDKLLASVGLTLYIE